VSWPEPPQSNSPVIFRNKSGMFRVMIICLFFWGAIPALRLDAEEYIGPISPREKVTAQHDKSHGNVLMAWTPRAGCTFAMELWFRFRGIYEEAVAYNRFLHKYRIQVLKKSPNGGGASKDDLLGKGNFKFKIVMNPYHRAVTMFEHAMTTKGLPQNNFTFIEFLEYLHRDNANGGFYDNENNPTYHAHYATQVALAQNDAIFYDKICKLEDDLIGCISHVNSKTGLNFSAPSLKSKAQSAHNIGHQHVKGDVPNIPFAQLKSMEEMPLTKDFYAGASGQRAMEFVRGLYRFDFEAYGYSTGADSLDVLVSLESLKWYGAFRTDYLLDGNLIASSP